MSDHSSIGSEVSKGLSAWGRAFWWMPMRLLSAWVGTPLVDAYAPVGLELAKHCRQPKNLKLWVTTRKCGWAGVRGARRPS